ncbi:MAG TPA: PPC domain-containing protein [Myxococcota bacterium]|nr:PPC domain-containing protein [Myxococcota bacterium]
MRWLSLLLAACGVNSSVPLDLPREAASPPVPEAMTLQMSSTLYPGGPFVVQVSGAVPGAPIQLMRSTGTIGAGDCPPELEGGCYGITRGSGYAVTLTLTANNAGNASFNGTLPATVPIGTVLAFQVIDTVANTGSNALARGVQNPPAPCTDDAFENNDTAPTARINPPNPVTGAISCPGDDDWWGLILPPGQQITATATFDHAAEGDLDLQLFNPITGVLFDTSESLQSPEVVSVYNGSASNLRLGVRAWVYTHPLTGPADWGNPGVPYTLSLSVGPPNLCPVDANEPDDDAASQAHALAPGVSPTFGACASDSVDWFTLNLPAGRRFEIAALHDSAEGDVDLYLFDAPQPNDPAVWDRQALARAFTGLDDDALVFAPPAPGTYWLAAHMYQDYGTGIIGGNTYNVRVRVVP